MKISLFLCIALGVMGMYTEADAQTWGVALKPGTAGVGVEITRSFGMRYNARVGATYFGYNYTGSGDDDYSMDADIRLSSLTAMVDWFPWDNIVHFTGGAFINLNDADAVLTPTGNHDVGGRTYTPAMLGNLTASFGFNPVAPYLGIGFGNTHLSSGFVFDLGVIYQGAPRVDMAASRLLEPSTSQASVIEDNLDWFRLYPVVSFGYVIVFR